MGIEMSSPGSSIDTCPETAVALRPKQRDHARTKRSRTSSHKVRTGCITCKKRHLKCDEARPFCGNCARSQRQCEGYAESRKGNPGFGQFCWNSKAIARRSPSPCPRAQLYLDRDTLDFQDSESRLYFQEFVGLVRGPWIIGATGSDLWDATLPQISRSSTTLRHAAMAIGALSMWHRQSQYGSLSAAVAPTLPAADGDAHYFHAVAHYCQSLKLQSQQSSVQNAVFLSILLLCFESLRGNRRAALDHVNHGLALLFSLVTETDSNQRMSQLAPSPRTLLSSVAEIFTGLAPQARMVLRGKIGSGLPLPNLTKRLKDKNETLESFLVLLSQLPRMSADLADIPARFNSLDEFQRFWAAVSWRQVTVGPMILEAVRNSNLVNSANEEDIEQFLHSFFHNPFYQDFYNQSQKVLQALDVAFLPLFNKIMLSDTRSPEYLRAVHLRLQYLGVSVLDNMPLYLHSDSLNSQTPLFREYISLAEVAIRIAKQDRNNPAHQLSLQRTFTLHLLLVSLFCRDAVVRDQALEMLRDYPGQDGLFHTLSLYHLALRNRRIERDNAVEGTEDEQWRRLWRREYVFEDGGNRIVLRYLEKDIMTGQWDLVEETADVQGAPDDVQWKRRPIADGGKLLMGELVVL